MTIKLGLVDVIYTRDSVPGILTTAALLHFISINGFVSKVRIRFVSSSYLSLPSGSKIAIVDIPLDSSESPEFVNRIREEGHEIVAVVDYGDIEKWLKVLGSFEGLIIKPGTNYQHLILSPGEILKVALGGFADDHIIRLCDAATFYGLGFRTTLSEMVNKLRSSSKYSIDQAEYLIRHLAVDLKADRQIDDWCE